MPEQQGVPKGYVKKDTMYIVTFLSLVLGFLLGMVTFSIYSPEPPKHSTPAPQQPSQESSALSPSDRARLLELEVETSRHPDNTEAWAQLGHFYFDNNRPADAIRAYEQSLTLEPGNPNVWTDLGVMYRRNSQPELAIKAFDKALALDSAHQVAMFNKGIVYIHDQKDVQAGVAAWEALLSINPDAKAPNGMPVSELVKQYR